MPLDNVWLYDLEELTGITQNTSLFVCSVCSRSYRCKTNLNRHLRYECGKSPKFLCHLCSFMTKHKSNLKQHVLARHPETI